LQYFDAPNIQSELPIGDAFAYADQVDPEMLQELEDDTEIGQCLENIVAFEVAKYVLFHVGGERTFDQNIPDHFSHLIAEEKERFKMLSGKDYVSKNSDW